MLRKLKILLVLSVTLWGLLGAFSNILDWSGTVGAVSAVTSMSTFEGSAFEWRATTNPVVVFIGALFIVLAKIVTGLLCLVGAQRMWAARLGDAATFAKAKTYALAGCAISVIMLFVGFSVIAEGWFELWRTAAMQGAVLAPAFRYGAMIALIALFVGARDEDEA